MKWLIFLAVVAGSIFFLQKKQKKTDTKQNKMPDKKTASSVASWLSHPIPFDDEEITLWTGDILIEFSYAEKGESKKRYRVQLRRVIVRDVHRLHLRGVDQATGEEASFFLYGIKTMILVKGKRLELDEFMDELGIDTDNYDRMDERYDQALEEHRKKKWLSSLVPVWNSDEPLEIVFSYPKSGGREKRTVALTSVSKNENNQLYFSGFCQECNAMRHSRGDRILTKITCDGKKYNIPQFVTERLAVDL